MFSLTSPDSPSRDEVLLSALKDKDPAVVQFGVMGLARSHSAAALPAVARLIWHPDRIVRLQVGPVLAAYGAAARPYVNELVRASATEQDVEVRKSFDAAIASIQSTGKE